MVNSTIKFVNSKSNLRLGRARMMGTPRALSKRLKPPPKNCLPGHLCLKTRLSTSGQPLRRRCLPKQNCSRICFYHRPLATPLNFGTITGNNSSCSTKYLARFCAHQQVKRRLSACVKFAAKAGTARLKCTQAVSQIHTLMTQPLNACRQALLSYTKRSHAAVNVVTQYCI